MILILTKAIYINKIMFFSVFDKIPKKATLMSDHREPTEIITNGFSNSNGFLLIPVYITAV